MGSSGLRIPGVPAASLTSHHNHSELQAVLTSGPGVQSLKGLRKSAALPKLSTCFFPDPSRGNGCITQGLGLELGDGGRRGAPWWARGEGS